MIDVDVVCTVHAAQGSYLSVFLTLIRGEMDELLDWPFSKRVSVTLMDQSDEEQDGEESRRHVTHLIDPNYDLDDRVSRASVASSTVCRPPFGVPHFIRLEELNTADRYIRNDTVIFAVTIDD